MGMAFKINVLQALKDKGYSTYRIKNDKLLSQSTLQKLREGKPVSWENIETFCRLLEIQPGELLEYNPDEPYDMDNIDIMKTQRRGEIRYLPFVTTLESIMNPEPATNMQ